MSIATQDMTGEFGARAKRERRGFFSVNAGGAVFGLPVDSVQTIFRLQSITPVPLGPPIVAGLVNLRGKVVTAISLAKRLAMNDAPPAQSPFAVAVDCLGETYALVVDSVGDAMECDEGDLIEAPPHVDPLRAHATKAYYRIDGGILPVLDIEALVEIANIQTQPASASAISGAVK